MRPVRIENYEVYAVDPTGRVINTRTGRELKYDLSSAGYRRVTMSVDGVTKRMTVHRIVAETYLDKHSDMDVVNHKDGDKLNNHISNLEWVSPSYNAQHAFNTGLRQAPNRLPQHIVDGVRDLHKEGLPRRDIALQFSIKESRVKDILYRYYK